MALIGSFATVRTQGARFPELAAALAYAGEVLTPGSTAHERIQALASGESHRKELAGGAFAIEAAYLTKRRPDGFFETHRKYIDVQVVVTGEELMEVIAREQLEVAQAYDETKDLIKYADSAAASVLRLGPGGTAVFWPADAHMGGLITRGKPRLVRKTVVKVPLLA
ncbi:MAG: hypothetical protein A3G75_00780 [Verrucomicrobia bacterium RIFCSPLOWO2_12_FULL_64_8]|nr:MAG: hypothetical protein A3G75_00780 [Verrucomicrobia bacterium RIFCSPLOWO2_12_FULL_64_8]